MSRMTPHLYLLPFPYYAVVLKYLLVGIICVDPIDPHDRSVLEGVPEGDRDRIGGTHAVAAAVAAATAAAAVFITAVLGIVQILSAHQRRRGPFDFRPVFARHDRYRQDGTGGIDSPVAGGGRAGNDRHVGLGQPREYHGGGRVRRIILGPWKSGRPGPGVGTSVVFLGDDGGIVQFPPDPSQQLVRAGGPFPLSQYAVHNVIGLEVNVMFVYHSHQMRIVQ
mmetsp:Transcript_39901/g.120104  ORF Transcript_39901/g.120104 Transcript_39901/m.120104 type:complete len:222 (+) Transcript_39901:687-1352(+)